MLVTVSADSFLEVIFGCFSQENSHWLDWEVNGHDFSIFLDLHVACVFLEEFV